MPNDMSAIDQVLGRLFERSKPKSNAGNPSSFTRSKTGHLKPSISRLARAGAAHGAAVFKLVTRGGAKDRAGLRGQMNYVFNDEKVARIIDPTGRVKPYDSLEAKTRDAIIRNWSLDWWAGTRNGQTSHMILSYPQAATIEQVEKTTRGVLEEMLNSGDARFKYIAAIHDDKEHHPHVHVIVNRRASDNSLFQLRAGTDFSYERFREAMAAHGERYGLRLDPSFRFERGITDRQPSRAEQLLAQKEGRAPAQRPRTGNDLRYASERIAFSQIAYSALAVLAWNADSERLHNAYLEISKTLEQEGTYKTPELRSDEYQRFDDYAALLNESLSRTQEVIATKDAASRAPYEKQLADVMTAFTSLNPDAPYARSLHDRAQSNSIYNHPLGVKGSELAADHVQKMLEPARDRYGLDPDALSTRLELGASSNYLEQVWIADDLRAVAAHHQLDLSKAADYESSLDLLTDAYSDLREDLTREQVIAYLPYLDEGYRWFPSHDAEPYAYTDADRHTLDLGDMLDHYRSHGAPEIWIAENKAQLAADLSDHRAREAEEHRDAIAAIMHSFTGDDKTHRAVAVETLREKGLLDDDLHLTRQQIGADLAAHHPQIPHHLIDSMARDQAQAVRDHDLEKERDRDRDHGPDYDR